MQGHDLQYKNLYTTSVPAKELYFVGASLNDLRDFPEDACGEAGHQLYLVQFGEDPHDWKPMTVGQASMRFAYTQRWSTGYPM